MRICKGKSECAPIHGLQKENITIDIHARGLKLSARSELIATGSSERAVARINGCGEEKTLLELATRGSSSLITSMARGLSGREMSFSLSTSRGFGSGRFPAL